MHASKLVSHNVYVHIHKSILNCVLCKVYVPYTGRPRVRLKIRTHVYTVYVRERERLVIFKYSINFITNIIKLLYIIFTYNKLERTHVHWQLLALR
jgi:hypothetical protein